MSSKKLGFWKIHLITLLQILKFAFNHIILVKITNLRISIHCEHQRNNLLIIIAQQCCKCETWDVRCDTKNGFNYYYLVKLFLIIRISLAFWRAKQGEICTTHINWYLPQFDGLIDSSLRSEWQLIY